MFGLRRAVTSLNLLSIAPPDWISASSRLMKMPSMMRWAT